MSAFCGMSGGFMTSKLLPPNVTVGIGGGGRLEIIEMSHSIHVV